MAMDDATLVKPSNAGFILRSVNDTKDEYRLEGEMIVGREAECAIAIRSGHISRYHAKINVMRSGVYIEDLHSTNGTFINGRKIKGRVLVSLGDEVTFDDVAYRVVSSQSGREDQTLLAPARHRNHEENTRQALKHTHTNATQDALNDALSNNAPGNIPPNNVQAITPKSRATPAAKKAEAPHKQAQHIDSINASAKVEVSTANPVINNSVAEAHNIEPPQAQEKVRPTSNALPPDNSNPDENRKQYESTEEENEHTRMLSGSQLNQHIERNRAIHKDVTVGDGPRLIIMTAPLRGKCFEFMGSAEGSEWRLGRESSADIHLTDKTISGDHARLTCVPEGYQLSATHAKNGILVNGESISNVLLQHNDKIQIGGTELLFKTDFAPAASAKFSAAQQEEQKHNRRHAFIGAAVILVALITVLIATKS